MPKAKNYGELRMDIDKLVGQLLAVHRKALETQEQLRLVASAVATQPADAKLTEADARQSANIDVMNERLEFRILPEETWPC